MTDITKRILHLATVAVVAFLLLEVNTVSAGEDNNRYFSAHMAYDSGDVDGAIRDLKKKIASHDEMTPIVTKWSDISMLMSTCINIDYFICIKNNIDRLAAIFEEIKNTNISKSNKQIYFLHYSYFFNYYSMYLGRESIQWALKNIPDFQNNLSLLGGEGSARGNLLAAMLYLIENQEDLSRNHLDSAIVALASSRDITQFTFARYLKNVLTLLMATGDSLMASRIYDSAENFIPHALSGSIPDMFQYRLMEAELLTLNNDLAGAKNAYVSAENLLAQLNLPASVNKTAKINLYEGLALNCVLSGDYGCAVENINKHPYKEYVESDNFEEIDNTIYYQGYLLVNVVSHVLFDVNTGSKADADNQILKLLDEFTLETGMTDLDEQFQAYKIFVQGLHESSKTRGTGDIKIINGASLLLANLVETINNTSNAFTQIGSLEKFITMIALGVMERTQDLGSIEKLALQIFELTNRTIRDEESQVIVDLANANSVDQRRKYHAYDRLNSNHNKMKLAAVKDQISRFNHGGNIPNQDRLDYRTLSQGLDFSRAKERVYKSIQSIDDDKSDRIKYIPKISELQTWLEEDEAYISVSFYFGRAFSLCVTKGSSSLKSVDFAKGDPAKLQKFLNQIRLLQDSLRSDHPPSISLDSQFPVSSSIAIYKTLLANPLSCAKNKSHIIWSPHDSLLDIPLSAVLDEVPARSGTGWDLVNASWLGRKYAFTYASSASSFMASRKLRRNKSGHLPFIGIGDPVLSGKAIDGSVSNEISMPTSYRNANAGLYDFYELPETSRELKGLSNALGDFSVLYLRENASERNLRREILSRYNIVAFSTHGLIKGEINGLDEAALVLSPEPTNYELYDGLLKSSEIANLNFSSDFSILSACNSDNFDVNDFGVEVQGISTAFSYAGSPTTVASLWSVDSLINESLITDLITNYTKDNNRGISTALQASVNNHFSNLNEKAFAHPRFWAAYRVFGDGGAVPESPTTQNDNKLNVANFYIGSNRDGGGAMRFHSSNGQDFYVEGYEDFQETDRYKSFVAKIDKKTEITWKHQHNEIINTGIFFEASDGMIFSGYESIDNMSKSLLYKLDNNGHFLWKKWTLDNSKQMHPVGGFYSKDDRYIGMFTESHFYRPKYTLFTNDQDKSIHFYQIKENGDMTLLGSESMAHTSALRLNDIPKQFVTTDNVYYSFSSKITVNNEEVDSVYGYPDICMKGQRSLLYKIDKGNLKLVRTQLYPSLHVHSIIELDDGRTIGAGIEGTGCTDNIDIVIFELNDDLSYKDIYREHTPFRTAIAKLIADGKKLYLIGTSERVYDIKKFEGRDDYLNHAPLPSQEESMDQFVRYGLRDLFAFELDLNGEQVSKNWIQAGSNIYAEDAALINGKLSIFGSVDGEVSWFQLQ